VPIAVLDGAEVDEFYGIHQRAGVHVRGGVGLTGQAQRRERRLGFGVTVHSADDPHDVFSPAQVRRSYVSLHHLASSLRRLQRPDRFAHHAGTVLASLPEAARLAYRRLVRPRRTRTAVLCYRGEQAPNLDSRVALTAIPDALGTPRVRLEWNLLQQDLANIGAAQDLVAREFRSRSLQPLPLRAGDTGRWRGAVIGAAHHMGTTRMHPDAREGVVDAQCRVHGTVNLYVAGSSVFPTSGWVPPTLTIVALAVRLADHLAQGAGADASVPADARRESA
jgi:choline dehydrogenase-like flavoprotein